MIILIQLKSINYKLYKGYYWKKTQSRIRVKMFVTVKYKIKNIIRFMSFKFFKLKYNIISL